MTDKQCKISKYVNNGFVKNFLTAHVDYSISLDKSTSNRETAVWKLIRGMPFLIVIGRILPGKREYILHGAQEMKNLDEFMLGQWSVKVCGRKVCWDDFSDEEKEFLKNRSATMIMIETDDMEVLENAWKLL